MKRISYAEDHLVTGDDIADAVLAYAQALAVRGRSDTIDVPAVDGSGTARRFSILVGPASQMLTSDSLTVDEARGDEIRDEALVADLVARAQAMAGPSPVPVPVGVDVVELETDQFVIGETDDHVDEGGGAPLR